MTAGASSERDTAGRPAAARSMLRERPFAAFLAAVSISNLGDRIAGLTVPFLVLGATGSAAAAGVVGAAAALPALVIAPWVGVWSDRQAKLPLIVAADVGRGAAFAALAICLLWLDVSVPLLAGLMFLAGIGDVVYLTAAGAYLPAIVGRPRLVAAHGSLETADAAATLTGPAIGGLLLQAFGAAVALFVNAASFIASAICLLGTRAVHEPPAGGADRRAWRDAVLGGFRLLATVPQQRVLQLAGLGLRFADGAIVLLVVALTKDVLGLSGLVIGIVLTGAGCGGLVASVVVAPRIHRFGWGRALGTALLTMAIATAVLALAGAALDGAAALAYIIRGATAQGITPDRLLGRMTAAMYLLGNGARVAGIFLAGLAITYLGHRQAFWLFAAVLVACALPPLLSSSARTRLDRLEPVEPTA